MKMVFGHLYKQPYCKNCSSGRKREVHRDGRIGDFSGARPAGDVDRGSGAAGVVPRLPVSGRDSRRVDGQFYEDGRSGTT